MIFDFGDVVVVPFPFTDQSASKKRPAVVISVAEHNRARPDVVFMAITSQLRPGKASSEAFLLDWQSAGLRKHSAVKPVIATLEQRLVGNRLGELSAQDVAGLRKMLGEIIGDARQNEG